jgi:hypothetical protein
MTADRKAGARTKPEKADPEQYQRFLEKAKELGLDPTSETDLHRFDDVLRRVARQPTQHEQPVKGDRRRSRKERKDGE